MRIAVNWQDLPTKILNSDLAIYSDQLLLGKFYVVAKFQKFVA